MNHKSRKITRVSNQYLLQQLITIRRLGSAKVSARVLVEAWQSQGRIINEVFFLHFDVLIEYGFLVVSEDDQKPASMASLLGPQLALDVLVTISESGSDFLERYYQR